MVVVCEGEGVLVSMETVLVHSWGDKSLVHVLCEDSVLFIGIDVFILLYLSYSTYQRQYISVRAHDIAMVASSFTCFIYGMTSDRNIYKMNSSKPCIFLVNYKIRDIVSIVYLTISFLVNRKRDV